MSIDRKKNAKRILILTRITILIMIIWAMAIATEALSAPNAFAGSAKPATPSRLPALLKKKSFKVLYIKNGNKKRIEYGKKSGLRSKGYSIFQGACTDGKYSYNTLYKKKSNKCRLIKIDPKTKRVVKKSKAYKIYHGNDIAYDSKRGRLVVVHGDGDEKRLSVFDPKTLKRRKVVTVRFSKAFKGASKNIAKKIKGMTGIVYDAKKDQFIVSLKGTFDYAVLDKSFKPVRMIRTKTKGDLQKQGMELAGRNILRVMNIYTKKGIKNYIYIYDMHGKYVRRVKIRTKSEVEDMYFLNGRIYMPTYVEKRSGKKVKGWSYLLKSRKAV